MTDKVKYNTGYGILHKSVMQDTNLSIEAKGIFAYLVTYAGNGDTAFPSRDLMCYHLGLSNHTLGKYLKELKEKGYIEVEQIKDGTKFSHNVYKLIPYVNSSHTEVSHAEVSHTRNLHTNNNSINNNNINNNNIKYKEVLDYLNEKAGKNFRTAESNNKLIRARYKEGYTLEDFKAVIDYKVSKWKGTDMEQYLRPSTLFGNKFQNYVNEIPNRSIESTKTVEEEDTTSFDNYFKSLMEGFGDE